MMLSKLLIRFACLLFIVHLSCAIADLIIYDNNDDVDVQSSDDNGDEDDRYYNDDDTVWLPRRRVRRQQRMSTIIGDVPAARGMVDRVTPTPRRDRIQSRRRKKLEETSRRGRGGGGRGWRRRGGSVPVFTTDISTIVDRQPSTTLTSIHPPTDNTVDLVTQSSEITGVTEDSTGGSILMETISDDGDDMLMILMPNNGTIINQRAVNACRTMRCPRHKVCLLNIQGLPMCRCPSVYHCRGLERRPVCTVDGSTYRNKCFLRVDECAANRRLRVLHRGSCRAGTGRRSFDGMPSQRRQRQRQRELEEYVASTDRRSHDEFHLHRRRGRIRRRRPRHNPVFH